MIVSFGEILVDMFVNEDTKAKSYFVGGAPFNMAYAAKNMENKVLFVGNVGKDDNGRMIRRFFNEHDMDQRGLRTDFKRKTTVAKVSLRHGERDFTFLRDDTADDVFADEALDFVAEGDIIHLGSLMLSSERGRAFFHQVITFAKAQKKVLSFDINFRSDIFKNKEEALSIYNEVYPLFDVVKFSEDELYLFTGERDVEAALSKLQKGPKLILVTLGRNGSLAYTNGKIYRMESIKVNSVDSTGAGDAFLGTFLAGMDSIGLHEMCFISSLLLSNLKFANIAGALATTKRGALSSIPTYKEVNSLLEKQYHGGKLK